MHEDQVQFHSSAFISATLVIVPAGPDPLVTLLLGGEHLGWIFPHIQRLS